MSVLVVLSGEGVYARAERFFTEVRLRETRLVDDSSSVNWSCSTSGDVAVIVRLQNPDESPILESEYPECAV